MAPNMCGNVMERTKAKKMFVATPHILLYMERQRSEADEEEGRNNVQPRLSMPHERERGWDWPFAQGVKRYRNNSIDVHEGSGRKRDEQAKEKTRRAVV